MPAMENQGAPSNSDMTRLQLFAEGSSIEPHLSGFPAPPQSGLDPGWTLEATAHRFPKVETTPSSSDHITSIQNHPGVEWASAQGPWARSGSASFGAESIESVSSFSQQGAYPLQYPATQPVEEFAWKHVSYLVNGQTDPWNATGPSQSRYQSLQSSYNAGPPSSNSSTSHLVQYTPLQSSQGSPARTPQQLGGSYTPSFETASPQPFEYTIFGTGAGQSLEVPHIRHAVVQPDVDDFEALRHVPIYHDVPPTISGTTPLPASQEGPRVSVSPERNQHEETIAVAGTQSKHDDPNVNLVCLQCSKHQKKCKKIFPGGVCVRCDGVKNPQTGLKCINESLRSIVLFRTTTDPSSRKPYRQLAREDIYLSPALDAVRSRMGPWITIHLSQGPGAIALSVLPFDQIKAVSLVPPDSEHAKLYAHPYALGPDARKHVEEFLDANYLNYMSHYLVKGERNELDFAFFLAATCEVKRPSVELSASQSDKYRNILRDALRLWAACRTMEGGWVFSEDQMLGLQGSCEGVAPLTAAPFIDYQMSAILVDILESLKTSLLDRLERLAREHDPRFWYIHFLVTYILLHSYSKLAKQQAQFARNRGLQKAFPLMSLMIDVQKGSQLLLSYFRHASNGKSIAEINWRDPKTSKKIAILPEEKILSMERLSKYIKDHRLHLQAARQNSIPPTSFDHDYYFTGQMFLLFWKPLSPITTLH